MTRPLSPAFLTTFALALVDDATAAASAAADYIEGAAGAAADITDDRWSTAFVQHAGYWSHYDHRQGTSVWPLPVTESCTELADFAARHFVLMADAPEPGDIYLLWSPAKRLFVRAGIVLGCGRPLGRPSGRTGYECLTIDGDTDRHGSLRGPCTAIVQRALSPVAGDRLIRWPLLQRVPSEYARVELPLRRAA